MPFRHAGFPDQHAGVSYTSISGNREAGTEEGSFSLLQKYRVDSPLLIALGRERLRLGNSVEFE